MTNVHSFTPKETLQHLAIPKGLISTAESAAPISDRLMQVWIVLISNRKKPGENGEKPLWDWGHGQRWADTNCGSLEDCEDRPRAAGPPRRTFSVLFREVSGFTRMDGGADAGGFGAGSLFAGGSLASRITELQTEGVLLSPPLTTSTGEASWAKFGLIPASATPAAGGMLCG